MVNDIKDIDRRFDAISENLKNDANNSYKWLKEFLSTCEGNSFDMTDDEGYAIACVSYDGGNHPEYNSTLYADVFSVYLANGKVYLELDETNEYEFTRLDYMERIGFTLEVARNAGLLIS